MRNAAFSIMLGALALLQIAVVSAALLQSSVKPGADRPLPVYGALVLAKST